MLTPEWMRSMAIVQSLPDGVPAADLEADPNKLEAAESVGIILETLGYSVYRHIVPLLVVDDLIGGTVRIAFRKMRAYEAAPRRRGRALAGQADQRGAGRPRLAADAELVRRDPRRDRTPPVRRR